MVVYEIIEMLDKTFLERLTIQDGVEIQRTNSRDLATSSMIRAAKAWNGATITANDIKYGKQVQQVVTNIVWEERTRCNCCGKQ